MIGTLRDMTLNRDGTQNVTVTVHGDFRTEFDSLSGKLLDIELKPHREKRSRDANAFCWALCRDIGNAMTPALPKEEVYRKAIREVGEYEPLPIRNDAVATFLTRWMVKGVGWFAEVIDDSKLPGFKLVFAYYGSSTYDSKAMSRLIDYLVDDAEQMGIPIPVGKAELDHMKTTWRANNGEG